MTKHTKEGAEGTPSNDADLIDSRTVAAMMAISYGSFRSYRSSGAYPTPQPLYKRAKSHFWSRRQVEAWLAERPAARAEA